MSELHAQPLAVVEVYRSKSALLHGDEEYHLDKIVHFVSQNFSIEIGTIAGARSNSFVTAPQNINTKAMFKIGDIVQVTLVNYKRDYFSLYNATATDNQHQDRRVLNKHQSAFVISSIDGSKVVLSDFAEFCFSFSTVGYAGSVTDIPMSKLFSIVGNIDFRAFPLKLYEYDGVKIPIDLVEHDGTVDTTNLKTNIVSEFNDTNITPWSIIKEAVENITDGEDGESALYSIRAVVERDTKGPYVYLYLKRNVSIRRISIRFRPEKGVDFKATNADNFGKFFVQPGKNTDNYIHVGVFARSGDKVYKLSEDRTVSTDNGVVSMADLFFAQQSFGFTTMPSKQVGFEEFSKALSYANDPKIRTIGEDLDVKAFKNEVSIPAEYREALNQVEILRRGVAPKMEQLAKLDEAVKAAVEKAEGARESSGDTEDGEDFDTLKAKADALVNERDSFENSFKAELEAYNNAAKQGIESLYAKYPQLEKAGILQRMLLDSNNTKLLEVFRKQLGTGYYEAEVEVDEDSFYGTDVSLDGDEYLTVYYSNPMGGINIPINMRVVNITFSPRGRQYKLKAARWGKDNLNNEG